MEQAGRLTTLRLTLLYLLYSLEGTSPEKTFHYRDHSDIEVEHHRQVEAIISPEAAQQYLVKYGWVNPINWEEQAFGDFPQLDQAPQDVSLLLSEGESEERSFSPPPNKTDISPLFQESLKKFQEANGLNATGTLDTATKLAMNKPRCGVPDHKAASRRKNSALSLLATNGTQENSTQEETSQRGKRSILHSLVEHYRKKRDNRNAVENGNAMSFAKRTLKWRLMGEGYSMQLTIEQQRRILRTAFRMWSEVIPLQFEEDLTGDDIDIRVGFGTGQHLGCSQAFDGVGQEFAHAWYLGEIHFDDDEHFVGPTSEQGISLLKVAVHEIGHALGLPHINRRGSVMQPNYTPQGKHLELDWEDRKAVQQKYGTQFWRYDSEKDMAYTEDWKRKKYPQLIAEAFPGVSAPVDAAFFDKKERCIYFFRENNVTAFSVEKNRVVEGFPKRILDVFPAVERTDHPIGYIDAVYFSYTHQTTYFIKDRYYWKMVRDQERQANASLPLNGLWPKKKINSKWYDICDVHPSVLFNSS